MYKVYLQGFKINHIGAANDLKKIKIKIWKSEFDICNYRIFNKKN